MINSVHYQREDGGWQLTINQTEDDITWETETGVRNLPALLDDLTGTWTDNDGNPRRVTACGHRTDDVWHVTNSRWCGTEQRHYDGDTIRIWWTLDLTSRMASA